MRKERLPHPPSARGRSARESGADGTPELVEVPAPTEEALQAVLHKIIPRTMKLLTPSGVLIEEQGQAYLADTDGDSHEARVLRPLQAQPAHFGSPSVRAPARRR